MTMDYSPCPKREICPFLKGSNISETGEATPTKIGVHVCDINPYLHEFSELFLKGHHISETKETTHTKTGVHARDVNPYLHKFFEPILID